MPDLDEETWLALRAEWEVGILSDRALAKKYGIDRTSIYRRRDREGWIRSPDTPKVVRLEAARRVRKAVFGGGVTTPRGDTSPPPSPPLSPPPSPQDDVTPNGVTTPGGDIEERPPHPNRRPKRVLPPALREQLEEIARAEAAEAAIQTIADATMRHLRTAEFVRRIAQRYGQLLADILDGDEEAAAAAAGRILSGRNDSVAAALQALIRAAESVQAMERRALGVESRTQVGLTVQGPPGGVVRTDAETGRPVIDVSGLTDAELVALQAVLRRLDEQRQDDLPLPPKGPEEGA